MPPEEFLNLFTWFGFSVRLIAFLLMATASATIAIVVLAGKTWGGLAFLNKDRTLEITWFG